MPNAFEEAEKVANNAANQEASETPEQKTSTEVNLDDLDDKAIGDKIKYERESLDGQTVAVKSLQIFNADTTDGPVQSMSGSSEYYKCNVIITYDAQNKDGLDNREYLSGAKQFVQNDGSLSPHQFWYEGAENQVAQLWEAVAKAKGITPKELSAKQFAGYCNSGVKAKIKLVKGKFQGKNWEKNLVEEFVK